MWAILSRAAPAAIAVGRYLAGSGQTAVQRFWRWLFVADMVEVGVSSTEAVISKVLKWYSPSKDDEILNACRVANEVRPDGQRPTVFTRRACRLLQMQANAIIIEEMSSYHIIDKWRSIPTWPLRLIPDGYLERSLVDTDVSLAVANGVLGVLPDALLAALRSGQVDYDDLADIIRGNGFASITVIEWQYECLKHSRSKS